MFGITDEKIRAYYYEVAFKHVLDSSVICHFYPYEYHHLVDAFQAAGGWPDFNREEIHTIGRRIISMARLFILREGSSHREDNLSPRSLLVLKDGPNAGRTIEKTNLEAGIQEYFRLMNWDDVGAPTEACLQDLGISAYA